MNAARFIYVFAILLLFFSVFTMQVDAKKITLLSIEKSEQGETGGVADLYLRTIPGTGNIYTATFPLTKLDTQISARFAKDIACDFLEINCDNKDFLYTIHADSPSVGGPSGGAAFAVLTIAELLDLEINESVAITGTINTGGLIGPVGGLSEKIEGAVRANITKVLIPKGTRLSVNSSKLKDDIIDLVENATITNDTITIQTNLDNSTIDLIELGNSLGIQVLEVARLDEAVLHITNKDLKKEQKEISIDKSYTETMKLVSEELCNRSKELKSKLPNLPKEKLYLEGSALFEKGKNATEKGEYYSAASFCFGSNVAFRGIIYEDLTKDEFIDEFHKITKFKIRTSEFNTIRNLQTYLIVKQRLDEKDILALQALEQLNNSVTLGLKDFKNSEHTLAFARERLQSAVAWSRFFDTTADKEFTKKELESSCFVKLQEAQQRYDYADIYFPNILTTTQQQLKLAYKENQEGDFESCLFKASLAKAEADTVLSTLGYSRELLDSLARDKLNVAKQEIAKQKEFPILAYSYYEYGSSLVDENPIGALSYAEYAIELSNLKIYFKEPIVYDGRARLKEFMESSFFALLLGIILGILVGKLTSGRDKI